MTSNPSSTCPGNWVATCVVVLALGLSPLLHAAGPVNTNVDQPAGPTGQKDAIAPWAAPARPSDRPNTNPSQVDEAALKNMAVRDKADANAADIDPIELSPFVVKGETGWDVTETLAGTRLKTDIRDIPSQIEGFTKDFMEDFAVNNIHEALIYSLNAENEDEFMRENAESAAANIDGGRIRGLGQATNSRGLFNSSFRSDNYNSGDTIVASGTNGVLFGFTSNPGIYDTNPSRAEMRNSGRVRMQYSSEDSKRAELNINRVLWPKVVSLRLDSLWEDKHTFRKPNWDQHKRYTISTTVNPFKYTQFRASYEEVQRDANLPPPTVAFDNVSLWYRANEVPGSPYTSPQPAYDNRNAVPSNVSTITRIFSKHGENPVITNGGTAIPAMSWLQSVQLLEPSAPTAFGRPHAFDDGVNNQASFMDETYFPFDVNTLGKMRETTEDGSMKRLNLNQQLAPGLHLELAYYEEHRAADVLSNPTADLNRPSIYVDANQYLPALLPGETTRRENPNFGKMYMEIAPNGKLMLQDRETRRGTLAYELDLAKKFESNRWGRWLGRHNFAGMAEGGVYYGVSHSNTRPRILGDPVIPGVTLRAKTNSLWARHASRLPAIRSYFDVPGSANAPLGTGYTFVDANGNPVEVTYGLDAGWRNSAGKRIGTSQSAGGAATKNESALFVWQGFFLPDREGRNRLVLTYGKRHDRLWTARADAATMLGDDIYNSGLTVAADEVTYDGWTEENSRAGDNITKGIVVHPLHWVSLFYNNAKTFGPGTQSLGLDPFGNVAEPGGGTNKDYGVQFNLWKDRLTLRYNRFQAEAGPVKAEDARLQNPIRSVARQLEDRVMELDPGLPQINVTDGNMQGYPGGGSYLVRSSQTSEGDELQLSFRPVPNWNIRMNYAQFKAIDDLIARDWIAWIEARLPVWEGVVAKNGEVDSAGRALTWQTAPINPENPDLGSLAAYYQNEYLNDVLAYIQAVEGKQTDNARNKRANLVTNYRFTEGKLKGWNITGAFRWRPPSIIGYPVKQLPDGSDALDIFNPWFGKREIFTDVGVAYRGRMPWMKGLSYTAQLNVRNVLDEGPTKPIKAYTDGTIARLGTIEPRLFIFTFAVNF